MVCIGKRRQTDIEIKVGLTLQRHNVCQLLNGVHVFYLRSVRHLFPSPEKIRSHDYGNVGNTHFSAFVILGELVEESQQVSEREGGKEGRREGGKEGRREGGREGERWYVTAAGRRETGEREMCLT